ncbi:MAG TPA: hypothetical protein VJ974_00950 [Geopsychrobacteraceae bacterium]|nr:hypothetical protein [Geopsychrobacteraceae bacterium]
MRRFANLLQVLLILNGAFSLFTGLFFGRVPGDVIETLYMLFASSVVMLGLLFLLCMGFNRNLPKRVYLPQLFLIFWDLSGMWPVSSLLDQFQAHLVASAGQVLFGFLALLYVYSLNRNSPFLTPEMFSRPGFRVGNLVRYVAGFLLLLPFCLLFFGFSLTSSYIDRSSGGFVRLGIDGLYMTERVYRQKGKTVRLASMIHIGDKDYYDDLAESISSGGTLVLAEGVTDQDGLLKGRFSYGGIADFLGLSAQEKMALDGRVIDARLLTQADFQGTGNGRPDIIRADIDLRDFDPQTLAFINALGTHLLSNDSFSDGYEAFSLWAQEHVTPETNDLIMADLVTKRNQIVIGHLAAALKKYDTIVIPWGALHMVGIEKHVIDRGFLLQSSKERRSIDFRKIPFAELFDKMSAEERPPDA